MTDTTIDVAALVERLRDESRALSWLSIERGSAEAGIASNLADEAATALQSQADALAANETELDLLRKRVDGLLTAEASLATMREALEQIAAFGDALGSYRLEHAGSYSAFDEPASVEIARRALGGSNAE